MNKTGTYVAEEAGPPKHPTHLLLGCETRKSQKPIFLKLLHLLWCQTREAGSLLRICGCCSGPDQLLHAPGLDSLWYVLLVSLLLLLQGGAFACVHAAQSNPHHHLSQ